MCYTPIKTFERSIERPIKRSIERGLSKDQSKGLSKGRSSFLLIIFPNNQSSCYLKKFTIPFANSKATRCCASLVDAPICGEVLINGFLIKL